MSSILVIAGLLLTGPQAAPAAGAGGDEPPPVASSPALVALAPELAALPGVVLVAYPVHGRTARAIRESLNRERPDPADDDPFDGRTDWRYQTRWGGGPAGRCDPSTVEVQMNITVTLPELTTREGLDRRERQRWDRYIAALVAHEHNHVRIVLAGAEQLRTYMRAAPDCATMQAVQAQISASMQEASRAYDETTGHGRTEGATYP